MGNGIGERNYSKNFRRRRQHKMADCDWAIICDYAFLDVGRKTCVIGVFDRIYTPVVPSVLHQAALAIKILGSPGEQVNFRAEIIRPTGGQLATFGGAASVPESGTVEIQVRIAGMPLPDWGVYGVNIYSGDTLLRNISFVVAITPTPQQGN
jgi:hypothetical protein